MGSCLLPAPAMTSHIDLLMDRVWLVLSFKTCTAQDAATIVISSKSVFCELGLPNCLV